MCLDQMAKTKGHMIREKRAIGVVIPIKSYLFGSIPKSISFPSRQPVKPVISEIVRGSLA
jgi:hypothetical protein